jgi:hypothetical protein
VYKVSITPIIQSRTRLISHVIHVIISYILLFSPSRKAYQSIIKYLLSNTFSERKTVAFQDLSFRVMTVRQMTANCLSPERRITILSLPPPSVSLTKDLQSLHRFQHHNQRQNSQESEQHGAAFWPYVSAMQEAPNMSVVRG